MIHDKVTLLLSVCCFSTGWSCGVCVGWSTKRVHWLEIGSWYQDNNFDGSSAVNRIKENW